jgi:hypothetical protein
MCTTLVARQRLGKCPPIFARELLGKKRYRGDEYTYTRNYRKIGVRVVFYAVRIVLRKVDISSSQNFCFNI